MRVVRNGLWLQKFEMDFFGQKAIPDNTYYNPRTMKEVYLNFKNSFNGT